MIELIETILIGFVLLAYGAWILFVLVSSSLLAYERLSGNEVFDDG